MTKQLIFLIFHLNKIILCFKYFACAHAHRSAIYLFSESRMSYYRRHSGFVDAAVLQHLCLLLCNIGGFLLYSIQTFYHLIKLDELTMEACVYISCLADI